ncbi:reverse transcriptase domain-containing protein [Tanacetum coccineum]
MSNTNNTMQTQTSNALHNAIMEAGGKDRPLMLAPELKTVSYHKLYDILKQHKNKVNEIRAERLARTANPLALIAQQQLISHPQPHPNHYTGTDIQEQDQKESQKQTKLSTEWNGQSRSYRECMRTRSQARRLRQHQRQQQQVPPNLVEPPKDTMADNRTMAELLQAPTEGYEDAIVVPEIAAANFEIKHGLLTLVQNKQFFGHDKEDPHAHIRYFNKITSTLRYPNVPTTSIKLMLFPFSLEGAARIWLEKEPPRSIQTWDDLVAKFINQFFPPSKTTNLRNEITNFKQRFDDL